MNIYAKKGDKVIFDNPNNGFLHDQKQCKKFLQVGNVYTVNHTKVFDWYTHVFFEEFPFEYFNSVMFSDSEEENELG